MNASRALFIGQTIMIELPSRERIREVYFGLKPGVDIYATFLELKSNITLHTKHMINEFLAERPASEQ